VSSSTRNGHAEWAQSTGSIARDLTGMVRRMRVELTTSSVWQVLGATLLNGAREVQEAEAFTGIGFYARPPASSRTEAMLVFPGGASVPVVIAARDEDVRRKVAADLKPNETQMHNSLSVLRIRDTGEIEGRSVAGVAESLTKHSDMQALADVLDDWVPAAGDGGTALKTLIAALLATGWPHGTSKLKGE
jgi:hypothetical protein